MDGALREAQRRVQESPDDGAARLAYAEQLLQAGFRAAAWLELRAASELGALAEEDPRRLRFRVPDPERPLWLFEPSPRSMEAVAAPLADARTPGVLVRSGTRTVPFVLFLGKPCWRCDDDGLVCEKCWGTGRCPDSLDNYEYDPWGMTTCRCDGGTITCRECRGTKFELDSGAKGCGHEHDRAEWTTSDGGVSLSRCETCGLSALRSRGPDWRPVFACPECSLLDCGCRQQ